MQPLVMSPMSNTASAIDVLAFALIMYDCIAVPLLLLEATEATEHTVMVTGFWISRIFWTLSIPRAFFTGYMKEDGTIEMHIGQVAKQYRNTWLTLDFVIVLADWLDAGAGGVVRVLRILKAARLARVLRVPNMIVRKMNHGSTEIMMLWLRVIKDTMTFIMLNHFLACLWYWVGTTKDGWVRHKNLQSADILDKYTYALHWSASQFIGSTEVMPQCVVERAFGAIVMIFAFIWSASFISRITAAMTRLQILSGQKGMLFSSLRQFLTHNRISESLAMRVIASAKFLVDEREKNQAEGDIELLQLLSEPMLIEIHYEVHSSVLTQHPFFWRYNHFEPLAVQKLCHSAIKQLSLAVGDTLFTQGEEPTDPRMFFVISGTLLYIKDVDGDGNIDPDEMRQVTKEMWVCEPVLWMKWTHCGNLRAATHCNVLTLSAEKFKNIISEYRNTSYPAKYATIMTARMNLAFEQGEVDDLCENIDAKEIVHEVFPHFLAKKGPNWYGSSFGGFSSPSSSRALSRSFSNLNRALKRSYSNIDNIPHSKSPPPGNRKIEL